MEFRARLVQRAWFLVAVLAYVACLAVLAQATNTSFNAVELNLTAYPRPLQTLVVAAILLGSALAFYLPGHALIDQQRHVLDRLPRAFILSVIAHTIALSVVKLSGAELTRTWFVVTCGCLWLVSMLHRSSVTPSLDRGSRTQVLVAALLVTVLFCLFFQKIFAESFTGDGTEHFEYARSLRTHLFPYWDLENGNWGFHHRFAFFAYPSLLSVLSVGDIEASVRLPAMVLMFFLFLLMCSFLPTASAGRRSSLAVLASGLFLLFLFNAFYSTWDYWSADIAEPTGTDLLTMYLVLTSLKFLLDGQRGWFVAAGLLASVCTQFGAVLLLLSVGMLLAVSWRKHARSALAFIAGYATLLALFYLDSRSHPRGVTIFSFDHLARYWSTIPDTLGMMGQLAFLALMSGGVVLVSIPRMKARDRLSSNIFGAAILYAALLACSSRLNPHYFLPPATLLLVAFARRLCYTTRHREWAAAAIVSQVMCIAIVAQPGYAVSTEASRLGRRVRIEASDYQTKVAMLHAIYEAGSYPFDRRGVGKHALIYYSTRFPCGSCDYVVTRASARAGFDLLLREAGVGLFLKTGSVEPSDDYNRTSYCPQFLRRMYTAGRKRAAGRLTGPATLSWALCLDTRS